MAMTIRNMFEHPEFIRPSIHKIALAARSLNRYSSSSSFREKLHYTKMEAKRMFMGTSGLFDSEDDCVSIHRRNNSALFVSSDPPHNFAHRRMTDSISSMDALVDSSTALRRTADKEDYYYHQGGGQVMQHFNTTRGGEARGLLTMPDDVRSVNFRNMFGRSAAAATMREPQDISQDQTCYSSLKTDVQSQLYSGSRNSMASPPTTSTPASRTSSHSRELLRKILLGNEPPRQPSSLSRTMASRLMLIRQKEEEVNMLRKEMARRRAMERHSRLEEPVSRLQDIEVKKDAQQRKRIRQDKNQVDGKLPQPHPKQDGSIITLSLPSDKGILSEQQLMIRESIQVFSVGPDELRVMDTTHQTRNANIASGQVGFCCKYCAHRPMHWRGAGAVYFPGKLSRVYQTAQNMASNHFLPGSCDDMPAEIKERFQQVGQRKTDKKSKRSKRSAGKEYWENSCRKLGLEDREGQMGVFLRSSSRISS